MTRTVFKILWCTLLVSAACYSTAQAQTPRPFPTAGAKPMRVLRPTVRPVSRTTEEKADADAEAVEAGPPVVIGGGYPQLSAPLYPSPVPTVPPHIGGTLITNPAFAPHETLYPHCYKAMYPPFYYKVKGGWIWTPWGIRSHDRWELKGTTVSVKYKTCYPWMRPFVPPVVR